MKVLHILNKRGGGIGTILNYLENKGETIWERNLNKNFDFNNYDIIIVWGYMPDFDFKMFENKLKIYYFNGLRALSRKLLFNKFEFNVLNLIKLNKFKNWLKNFDYFLSCSFSMAYMAEKFYNVKSFVIHNAIDFDKMPDLKRERNNKVLLWIGRSAWVKGLDRFLKLMDLLPEYEGWVVGVEGKNYNNIKFFGYVNNVYEFINKAKAVIITSYYEALPYVCIESLYYGVPVLTLKSAGGCYEALQILNKYEWCFDDIYQMAYYIKNYDFEDFKRNEIFNEFFSFERYYERYRKILEKVLSSF